MHTFHCSILFTPKFQILSYRLAIVLYLSIITIGNIPGARADIGEYASGGVLHSIAYGVIAFLLFVGRNGNKHERVVKAMLAVMAMGAFDEYVQSFFPYRSADVIDWIVDVIAGIVSSAMLWTVWPKIIESE